MTIFWMNIRTDHLIRIPNPSAVVVNYFINPKEVKNKIYIVKIITWIGKKILCRK